MNHVTIVPINRLSAVWPEVQGWLESAIKVGQGDEGILDVFVRLARGEYMLWHSPGKYAAVAQIQEHAQQKVGVVLYCGGTGLEAMKLAFEEGRLWCKQNGIDVIRTFGRKGWARVVGLKEAGVILQERL